MKNFPTLYKITSTGATQTYRIYADASDGCGKIVTIFGQLDGKLQTTSDIIKEGKNVGKINETSPYEQACLEAESKWEKKLKSGYVKTVVEAEAGEVDELIEGGIVPMLAQSFKKHGHKINFPAFLQPKLDGHRMICILEHGKATLWSRTRKQIYSLPHIIKELETAFPKGNYVFDGEGYNQKYAKNFEHLSHIIRQEAPVDNCTDVEYHVYDMVSNESFAKRTQVLKSLIPTKHGKYVVFVETVIVHTEDEVAEYFGDFRFEGYEGAMLRNENGKYVNKRSYDLQKVKEMEDAEFEILGVEEGRGKLQGHAGAFVCRMKDGKEFKAKMAGDQDLLKQYFEKPHLWKGKLLTVKFQGLTGYGMPRFPVGLRIRENL